MEKSLRKTKETQKRTTQIKKTQRENGQRLKLKREVLINPMFHP